MTAQRSTLGAVLRLAALVFACAQLAGCGVDSFFNPSVTGYWEPQPTTMPILERIDVIEQEPDYWGQTTEPTPDDLIPSDLTYRMVPGDVVTIQILDLYMPGQWATVTRRLDPGGFLRVQELGDVQAGGLTAQELEDGLSQLLERDVMTNPQVDVVIEQGAGFRYTLYGFLAAPGLYNLQAPDLTLIQALALAGGGAPGTEMVYIIRRIELADEVTPEFLRGGAPAAPAPQPESQPVDIEDLIERLDEPGGGASPGVLRQQDEPVIDIEDLEPARVAQPPQVDVDELRRQRQAGGSWIYVEERGEWVRVAPEEREAAESAVAGEAPLYIERIIEIPYERLERGESKYNIIVRPNDRIFVEPPETGLVYIEGQIIRPGPYSLPTNSKLTLSRLVATAGGLGQLAIPERVDLIRMVGDNREAVITVNLGAIRQKTEPDILLKPDDHIIIGTSWFATPLAVIRNGFRATYGFGFLLDRNFGNDVFGAPPVNYRN